MRKWIALLLAAAMVLSLCACGGKSTICGMYVLDSLSSEGQNFSADEISGTASSIYVIESDSNMLMSLYIQMGDAFHLIKGYISDESKEKDVETYKFWIHSMTGTLSTELEWLYINYYPKTDTLELSIDGVDFEFTKNTDKKIESALVNMIPIIERKNGAEDFGFWSDHYDVNSDTYHFVYTLDYDAVYAYVVSTGTEYVDEVLNRVQGSFTSGEQDFSEDYASAKEQFAECKDTTIVIDVVGFDGTVIASYDN